MNVHGDENKEQNQRYQRVEFHSHCVNSDGSNNEIIKSYNSEKFGMEINRRIKLYIYTDFNQSKDTHFLIS